MANRIINMGSGNYNENVEGDFIEGDMIIVDDEDGTTIISQSPNGNTIINQKGNHGIGVMSGGTLSNAKIAGKINIQQQVANKVINMDKAEGLHIGDTIIQQTNVHGDNVAGVSQVAMSNISVGGDINIQGIHQSISGKAKEAAKQLKKQAKKAKKNFTMTQKSGQNSINIQSGANINATGAGAFSLGDITGKVANIINKATVIKTNTTEGEFITPDLNGYTNAVAGDKTIYLNEDETPEVDESLRINVKTIVNMIKMSIANMPADASRMERYLVVNEIVERIEENPDLVEIVKDGPDALKAILMMKLGQEYDRVVSNVIDELTQ